MTKKRTDDYLRHDKNSWQWEENTRVRENLASGNYAIIADTVKIINKLHKSKKLSLLENLEIQKAIKRNKNLKSNQTVLST